MTGDLLHAALQDFQHPHSHKQGPPFPCSGLKPAGWKTMLKRKEPRLGGSCSLAGRGCWSAHAQSWSSRREGFLDFTVCTGWRLPKGEINVFRGCTQKATLRGEVHQAKLLQLGVSPVGTSFFLQTTMAHISKIHYSTKS